MTWSLLLVALAATWPGPPRRQASTLDGIVVNARTLAPVVDARVTLAEIGSEVRTSVDGRFVFEHVPPGTHTLTVSMVGFVFVRRTIDVTDGARLTITIP